MKDEEKEEKVVNRMITVSLIGQQDIRIGYVEYLKKSERSKRRMKNQQQVEEQNDKEVTYQITRLQNRLDVQSVEKRERKSKRRIKNEMEEKEVNEQNDKEVT